MTKQRKLDQFTAGPDLDHMLHSDLTKHGKQRLNGLLAKLDGVDFTPEKLASQMKRNSHIL